MGEDITVAIIMLCLIGIPTVLFGFVMPILKELKKRVISPEGRIAIIMPELRQ